MGIMSSKLLLINRDNIEEFSGHIDYKNIYKQISSILETDRFYDHGEDVYQFNKDKDGNINFYVKGAYEQETSNNIWIKWNYNYTIKGKMEKVQIENTKKELLKGWAKFSMTGAIILDGKISSDYRPLAGDDRLSLFNSDFWKFLKEIYLHFFNSNKIKKVKEGAIKDKEYLFDVFRRNIY